MQSVSGEIRTPIVVGQFPEQRSRAMSREGDEFKLPRWLVSCASGPRWYPVGGFVALDAPWAIDRAIEVFGRAADHRAEEIPRDAAPLPKPNPPKRPG